MSNTIPPLASPALPGEQNGAGKLPPGAPLPAAGTLPASEAVTLSTAAQTNTQLLASARNAGGVDHAAVQQTRTALQSGNYNVAPEDLAQAILTVVKESR
jgi:flagellar biosynthesis anti-sigma factor FlgM